MIMSKIGTALQGDVISLTEDGPRYTLTDDPVELVEEFPDTEVVSVPVGAEKPLVMGGGTLVAFHKKTRVVRSQCLVCKERSGLVYDLAQGGSVHGHLCQKCDDRVTANVKEQIAQEKAENGGKVSRRGR